MDSIFNTLSRWSRFVAFPHTIFALPFAISALIVAAESYPLTRQTFLLVLLCLVTARNTAMSFNRIVDAKFDVLNPRTINRELPSRKIKLEQAVIFCLLNCALFLVGTYLISPLCLALSPLVLAVLLGYSLFKRFSSSAHLVLGLALALAPGGAWVALSSSIEFTPVPLMLAVLFWVAGFDIIYACQDLEFDRKSGLFSVPARIGIERSLNLSKLFHLLSLLNLLWFGMLSTRAWIYFISVALFALFLLKQHSLVSARNLSRVNQAFFTVNGMASLVFMIGVLIDSIVL